MDLSSQYQDYSYFIREIRRLTFKEAEGELCTEDIFDGLIDERLGDKPLLNLVDKSEVGVGSAAHFALVLRYTKPRRALPAVTYLMIILQEVDLMGNIRVVNTAGSAVGGKPLTELNSQTRVSRN